MRTRRLLVITNRHCAAPSCALLRQVLGVISEVVSRAQVAANHPLAAFKDVETMLVRLPLLESTLQQRPRHSLALSILQRAPAAVGASVR